MYSSSYKHRPATLSAFEDAYAKEAFLKRSASSGNTSGCTPYSEKVCHKTENCREDEALRTQSTEIITPYEKTPSECRNPKKGNSGLFSGMDGGDILLVLLIIFFLSDKDSENDGLIPILLASLLIF